MPYQEQLPFSAEPDSRRFSSWRMQMAHDSLSELEDPNNPWPDEIEPFTQEQWDRFRHNAYDQGWLERRINKMIERGRIPFHTYLTIDEETGELIDREAFFGYESASFFRYKTAPKSTISGGGKKRKPRLIHAPNKPMEYVHEAFNAWAGENYPLHEAAYGVESDKSYLDAAIAHAGNRYFLKLDIASAYDAVDPQRLAVQLANSPDSQLGPGGWFPIVRRFFVPPDQPRGLATGGNSSPLLFNIYMRPVDEVIAHYAAAFGMTYTRYMDDIILSAPDTGRPDFDQIGRGKAKFIKRTLAAVGMEVNDHKVRYKDLETDGPILLAGTQLDAHGEWQIPERVVRTIAEFLDEARVAIESGAVTDSQEFEKLSGEVHGINSYISHFISRRPVHEPLHPSETLLANKYFDCSQIIYQIS